MAKFNVKKETVTKVIGFVSLGIAGISAIMDKKNQMDKEAEFQRIKEAVDAMTKKGES
jgi:hypothetical protein